MSADVGSVTVALDTSGPALAVKETKSGLAGAVYDALVAQEDLPDPITPAPPVYQDQTVPMPDGSTITRSTLISGWDGTAADYHKTVTPLIVSSLQDLAHKATGIATAIAGGVPIETTTPTNTEVDIPVYPVPDNSMCILQVTITGKRHHVDPATARKFYVGFIFCQRWNGGDIEALSFVKTDIAENHSGSIITGVAPSGTNVVVQLFGESAQQWDWRLQAIPLQIWTFGKET